MVYVYIIYVLRCKLDANEQLSSVLQFSRYRGSGVLALGRFREKFTFPRWGSVQRKEKERKGQRGARGGSYLK